MSLREEKKPSLENICRAVVDPRRRLGPTLSAGNVFVVLAGLLGHAMLPAEIS